MQFSGITVTGGITSAFAAPTDPYWANVSFLSQSVSTNGQTNNTFLDSSTNNFTITRVGSATQGTVTPFIMTSGASYSTSVNGGSGYFNGSTDYLTISSNAAFTLGTGDFTVECWVYLANTTGSKFILDMRPENTDGAYPVLYMNGATATWYVSSAARLTGTVAATTWTHIAVCRSSGVSTMFINGVQAGATYTDSNSYLSSAPAIGSARFPTGSNLLNGYLSSTRIVKGVAVYTSTFTPSTLPLPATQSVNVYGSPSAAITGTQTSLLLNYTNAGMYDATTISNPISVGTAQASTTQAKWPLTSSYFNGSTSYLSAPSNTAYAFGTGDFTVEGWIYFNSTSPSISGLCQSDAVGNSTSDKWWFGYSAGGLYFACHGSGTPYVSTPFTPSTGTWYYITATRSSGTMYLFVNGVSGTVTSGNGSLSGYNLSQNGLTVGGISTPVYLNGYIQDLRITKGVARYTATFTSPTQPLPTSGYMIATGGTITTDGNFKVHTFTANGTFTVQSLPGAISYLVVAGGGGGGGHILNDKGGGGGGAGGLLASTATLTATGAYTITVGTGGAGGVGSGGSSAAATGSNGTNSSIAGTALTTVTATGGGGGGPGYSGGPFNGVAGGSGGGAVSAGTAGGTGGAASPAGQGNAGGNGNGAVNNSAGGGGAGATGGGITASTSGAGGAGSSSSINGVPTTYAGGGGGGAYSGTGGAGGAGGGGAGKDASTGLAGDAGTDGLGGGGGGAAGNTGASSNGGKGGNGVVIIRYQFQ
jgi:hypothetical protein